MKAIEGTTNLGVLLVFGEAATKQDKGLHLPWLEGLLLLRVVTAAVSEHRQLPILVLQDLLQNLQGSVVLRQEQQVPVLSV